MVALARLVIVAHQAAPVLAAVQPILESMRPIRSRFRQCPYDHFDRDITLDIPEVELLPRIHMVYGAIM